MSGWQPQQYDPRQQRPATPAQRQPDPPPGYRPPPWPPQGYQQPQPQWRQPQYQVQPYQPQQLPYAPVIAPKSTAAGLVLGLLIPGAGCMYAGRVGVGILILAVWLVSIPLAFFVVGILSGLVCWVISAVLGYTMTRDWNAAHGIVS